MTFVTIDPRDITVVVQGPIVGTSHTPYGEPSTRHCLESVRQQLPGAEIVLSTWNGADVRDLSYDRLVTSADPGAMLCGANAFVPAGVPYNANRQIVSTTAGLRTAVTPYAMKLRSDLLLSSNGFLRYFGAFLGRHPEWRAVGERVVASTCFSRNPHRRLRYAFHPSDWFHFGRRDDVLAIWDVPLAPEPSIPRWHVTHARRPDDLESWALYRYTVEQYLWVSFLRKFGEVAFTDKLDATPENIALSELTIANNLVLADPDDLGIVFTKYPITLRTRATLYSYGEWHRLYRRYCEPAAPPVRRAHDWADRAYARISPVHEFLLSPRTTRVGRAVSDLSQARFPGAFRAARRAYVLGLGALGRLGR